MNQIEGENLPTDRILKKQLALDYKFGTESGTVLPHNLNMDKVAKNVRMNAALPAFKEDEVTHGESTNIQCSTAHLGKVSSEMLIH